MKQKLEYVVNVTTVVACIAIFSHLAFGYYSRYQNRPVPPYQPGDVLTDTVNLGLARTGLTVLVGTSSTCQFCRESMPFYERLEITARQKGARVVAYTNEDLTKNRQFFADNGVEIDDFVDASDNKVNLVATPSIVVVRSNGTVVQAWRGKLTAEQEDEVLGLIQKG